MLYFTLRTIELSLNIKSNELEKNIIDTRYMWFVPRVGEYIEIPTNNGTDDKKMLILSVTHGFEQKSKLGISALVHAVAIECFDIELYEYHENYKELVRK